MFAARSIPVLVALVFTAFVVAPVRADITKTGSFTQTVKPGETHNNGDVTVSNSEGESTGNAYVDPKIGTANSATDVRTQGHFVGEVSGLDANDTASFGASSTATVSGTGGSITVAGGSTVTLNNSGGQGSSNMEVKLPGGSTVVVPPGAIGVIVKT